MPDEKFIKAALDAQKALRPYAETIEAATRASRFLTDMARDIEQNSALTQTQEIMKRQGTLSRAAFGPMYDLRHLKIFDLVGPWERDAERIRQVLARFSHTPSLPRSAG